MPATTKTCPHCSEDILKTAKVCKHCGRDLVKKTSPVAWGCLGLLALIGGCFVIGVFAPDRGNRSGQSPSSSGRSAPAPAATTQTFTLSDGSQLTISGIAAAPDWSCGTRKTGQMDVPGYGLQPVNIYFDRAGNLVTVNAGADNTKLHDASAGRECLMNWKTNQMELLTEAQYKQYEREAGKD